MNRQPLLICFLSVICGIFTQEVFAFPHRLAPVFLGVGLVLVCLLLIRNFFVQKLRGVILSFFFFLLGISVHDFHQQAPDIPSFSGKETSVFRLEKKLNSTTKNRRYVVVLTKGKNEFASVLSVPKEYPELDFEHVYRGKLWISRPKAPDNDFQFNYARYLARQKIYCQSYLSEPYEIATPQSPGIVQRIKQNRFALLEKITASHLSDPVKNFLKGIILADRTEMDEVTVQDFNRSGLVHFLAISGTHVVVIYLMIMVVLQFVIPVRFRKAGVILSLLMIWGFAMYIGFGSSVVRSCIMISVYHGYVLLQRKADLLHSLALAGLMILFIDSQQLFDIGFQLSFLAVFGIFWLNGPLLAFLPAVKSRLLQFLFQTTTVSLSAQLITLPLVLFYFHQFSWMSVPANIVIVPFSEVIIIFSFIMTIFYGVGLDLNILSILYDAVTKLLLSMIHSFAEADFAFCNMIPMSLAEVVCALGAVFTLRLVLIRFNGRSLFIFAGLLFCFMVLRSALSLLADNRSEIVKAGYFRDTVVIVKRGAVVDFYMHQKSDTAKIRRSIVEPYLSSRRVSVYRKNAIQESEVFISGTHYRLSGGK